MRVSDEATPLAVYLALFGDVEFINFNRFSAAGPRQWPILGGAGGVALG